MFHCQELKEVPDLLALHQLKPDVYPYLLASNTRGAVNTRFSILLAHPQQTYIQTDTTQDILEKISTPLKQHSENTDLPFIGGWFVYLGYEYAANIESGVEYYPEQSELPMALISRIPAAVIIDHEKNTSSLVSHQQHPELIETMQQDIVEAGRFIPAELPACEVNEEDPDLYRSYLARTHQYITDGDIFQANLSRLWQIKFSSECDPVSLYKQLTVSNPAPFASMIRIDGHYILSSSPERLVSVENGIVETRPIAGTHPRGKTPQEDKNLSEILIKHPKERAEHVMLIDLERNDLGRICVPGSIHVNDKMIVESYQHVHHIVSSVRGKLQQEANLKDVVHAVFPGGTITGCPKVRCMQIISELEQAARGAYTGSLGYISDHGRLDLNILIRTMTLKQSELSFRAGAGIVHDSITEKELNETRFKARGMLNAVQPDQ